MTVPSCDDKRALRLIAAEAPADWHGIVGASPVLVDPIRRIEPVSASRSTVLITGETGTCDRYGNGLAGPRDRFEPAIPVTRISPITANIHTSAGSYCFGGLRRAPALQAPGATNGWE